MHVYENVYENMNVCEIKHQNTVQYYTCKRTTLMRSLQEVRRSDHAVTLVSLHGGGAIPSCNSRSVIKCECKVM
jgi:hypothetical protein